MSLLGFTILKANLRELHACWKFWRGIRNFEQKRKRNTRSFRKKKARKFPWLWNTFPRKWPFLYNRIRFLSSAKIFEILPSNSNFACKNCKKSLMDSFQTQSVNFVAFKILKFTKMKINSNQTEKCHWLIDKRVRCL